LPDSAVNNIDFTTSSPGISASYRWASIIQQQHPFQYSRIILKRNLSKKTITGTAQNVLLLRIALNEFGNNVNVAIQLDSSNVIQYTTVSANDSIYILKNESNWTVVQAPNANDKNPGRYGGFKEAFNNHMLFVVGTNGTREENEVNRNKAIYDAESWYYRGNGSVDIISDKEFSAARHKNRNVIIYGNANTNVAWKILLNDCPIQVANNKIEAGKLSWAGDSLAAYFVWPQKDPHLLTGVITATGITGMKAAYASQYFAGGSGFPDFMIFTGNMPKEGSRAIKLAGFFDNQWRLTEEEDVTQP
jgi:hypothetical protein